MKNKKIFIKSTIFCFLFILLSATMIQPARAATTNTTSDVSFDITQESDNIYTLYIDDMTLTVELIENGQRVSTIIGDEIISFETTTELKPIYDTSLKSASDPVEYVRVMMMNGTEIMELPMNPIMSSQSDEDPNTPSRGSTYYLWDGIYFEKDPQYLPYPHPYRNYASYNISPYSDWSKQGNSLIHHQVNKAKSNALARGGPAVLGAAIGGIITAPGGGYAAVVGAVVGAVITEIIVYFCDWQILDEYDCIWWWINTSFVAWVNNNMAYLFALLSFTATLPFAAALIGSELRNTGGYIRVGSLTFLDVSGRGNP